MVAAAVGTPLLVLASLAAVVALLPGRILGAVALAAVLGSVMAVRARKRLDRARLLGAGEEPELRAVVERLCVVGDLPRPEIALDDERQPNSWMVDLPGRPPRLHVTRGLLDVLDGPELEAVVAHELSHLANRDATVMTVAGWPGAMLLEGGRSMMRGWWWVAVGAAVAAGIGLLSRAGTNALSRYRELSADAGAAALTGRPSALASALVKVSGTLDRLPARDLRAVAGRDAFHLMPVEDPRSDRAGRDDRHPLLRRLGATHPTLEVRLAALERLERKMGAARPGATGLV